MTNVFVLFHFLHHLYQNIKKAWKINFQAFSVREKIRTPDTLVRSQVLYPAELHVHNSFIATNIFYNLFEFLSSIFLLFLMKLYQKIMNKECNKKIEETINFHCFLHFQSYCRRPESNRYGSLVPQDFKSCASACSATPADGTYRARTYDPLLVRQMLSQLS